MHRIARPDDLAPFAFDTANEFWQVFANFVGTETANQRDPAAFIFGIQLIDQAEQFVRLQARPTLQTNRIFDTAHELQMRAIRLPRAVADP